MSEQSSNEVRLPTEIVTIASAKLVEQVRQELERTTAEDAEAKALRALESLKAEPDDREKGQ